jgi:hypothetical protein
MASGTVGPSTPSGVQGSAAPTNTGSRSPYEVHDREKRMVASVRPPTQRHLNPFVITDRPEEKHLGISACQLTVRDFVLLKTLGTGKYGPVALMPLYLMLELGFCRYICPSMANEITGREIEAGQGLCAKDTTKGGWYEWRSINTWPNRG